MTDDRAHVLYRFYSATGQLLYVGITMNPPQRFKSHRDTKEWWATVSGITVENYSSRDELAAAERRAIRVEHPLHNIVHAKTKPEPRRQEPATASLADLFGPPKSTDVSALFGSLFGRNTERDRREAERLTELRDKQQARSDCPICDHIGYRPNGYVCDHIDHSGSRIAQAFRNAQKLRLQVVQGGA